MKLTALLYRDIAPYKKVVDESLIHLWSLTTRTDSDADETKQRTVIQVGKTDNNIGYQIRKTANLIFLPNSEKRKTANRKGHQNRKSDTFQCKIKTRKTDL